MEKRETVLVKKLGAEVRIAEGEGDLSVFGLMPEDLGPGAGYCQGAEGQPLFLCRHSAGDVLLMAGGNKVDGVEKLERLLPSSGKLTVTVRRKQENRKADLQF